MAAKARTRKTFGAVRKLPLDRFQAPYSIDNVRCSAPDTLKTKTDANVCLNTIDSDITLQSWPYTSDRNLLP